MEVNPLLLTHKIYWFETKRGKDYVVTVLKDHFPYFTDVKVWGFGEASCRTSLFTSVWLMGYLALINQAFVKFIVITCWPDLQNKITDLRPDSFVRVCLFLQTLFRTSTKSQRRIPESSQTYADSVFWRGSITTCIIKTVK